MARSPTTPDKVSVEAAELSQASGHSSNQTKSTSKAQNVSALDPSPASTYGDTAGTSSVPATPLDYRKAGKSTILSVSTIRVFCSPSCGLSDSLGPIEPLLSGHASLR